MCWTFSEIQSRKWRDKRILKRIDSNVKKVKKTIDNDNESELFSKFLKRIDSNVKSIKMSLGKKVVVKEVHCDCIIITKKTNKFSMIKMKS